MLSAAYISSNIMWDHQCGFWCGKPVTDQINCTYQTYVPGIGSQCVEKLFTLPIKLFYSKPHGKHRKVFSASLGFSYRVSFKYYDKGYQQMALSFVIFLYLHVSSLHVSGFYQPIIRGILSCCLCAITWFL